jgi:hypothetical protein
MVDCPVCSNEVPLGAPRCKHCFSDLGEHWEGGGGPSVLGPIAGVLIMALVMAGAIGWAYSNVYQQGQLGLVSVDDSEQRMVLVYTAPDKPPRTRQFFFKDIASIEMEGREVIMAGQFWSVFLVTTGNERVLLKRSEAQPLEDYANNLAAATGKQLTIINHVKSGQDMSGAF